MHSVSHCLYELQPHALMSRMKIKPIYFLSNWSRGLSLDLENWWLVCFSVSQDVKIRNKCIYLSINIYWVTILSLQSVVQSHYSTGKIKLRRLFWEFWKVWRPDYQRATLNKPKKKKKKLELVWWWMSKILVEFKTRSDEFRQGMCGCFGRRPACDTALWQIRCTASQL